MLPYTTYNIPESLDIKPPSGDQWLWIIIDNEPGDEEKTLLAKISNALNADFEQDTYCLQIASGDTKSLAAYDGPKPKLMISFGVAPAALGLWIDLPKTGLLTLERFSFILTASLVSLAKSSNAKKDLWIAMQRFMESK